MKYTILERLYQYAASIVGGLIAAFESSIPFFIPCALSVVVDIWSAYDLNRRLHRKDPKRYNGKFKSDFKFRVVKIMIFALILIICANYVDTQVIQQGGIAVRFVMGVFFFYQLWSILENWSSENDNSIAKALQRIMVNKAERHLGVELSDILLKEPEKTEENE